MNKHDNSDSFSEFSQDSGTDILDRIYRDAEISGPVLSDRCSNSSDGQVSGNVDGEDGGNDGASGGYNDEDDDNEDWALWDEITMISI
jgi:hypothetical protein